MCSIRKALIHQEAAPPTLKADNMGNRHSKHSHRHHKAWEIAARYLLDVQSAHSSPWLLKRGSGIFTRNATDPTGRLLMETRPYTIARFHHGAWVGMSILATVLLIISALLAGLTLGVCGLDSTLLQLRCITGTPRERYVIKLSARRQPANKTSGDKLAW